MEVLLTSVLPTESRTAAPRRPKSSAELAVRRHVQPVSSRYSQLAGPRTAFIWKRCCTEQVGDRIYDAPLAAELSCTAGCLDRSRHVTRRRATGRRDSEGQGHSTEPRNRNIPLVLVVELSERPRTLLTEVQATLGVPTDSRTAAGKVDERNEAARDVRRAEAAELLRTAGCVATNS